MPVEHDFTTQGWGYHLKPWEENKQEITKRFLRKNIVRTYQEYWGHHPRLREGDIIKVHDRDGRIIRYTIRNLRYERDPWDMFWLRIYHDEIQIDDT